MARTISEEELQLKKRARRRLVGAIVLVTAVAVILPMVLDSEPRRVSQNVEIQIPPADSGEFKPKGSATGSGTASTAAAPDASSRAGTDTPESEAAGKPDDGGAVRQKFAAAEPAKKASEPREKAAPRAAREVKEAREAKATPREPTLAGGAYVVQLAALSDPAKAKQLQKQVAGAGVKAYTEVVSAKSGEVTRVRAGPYATREAAERAREQLKKAGLDGRVVPR
jgi:DedD protein